MQKWVLCLFLNCFFYAFHYGQTTGSFQLSIDFPQTDYNETRTLYFYVPADYNPDNAYKIIVGFRGGPHSNAGQFRDQLQPLSDSLDAIIMCPENQAHFWNQEGETKKLFQYALDTTMALYSIDPEFVYLTGLSYGGRHAVIVAMDTDDGPIPNLRGVIPFAAGSEADLQPNYDGIDQFPPACICIGLSDSNNFITVSNNLHNDIQTNGGASILNEISGVGHTVAFPSYPSEMMECFNFIEAQYETTDIKKLDPSLIALNVFPNPAKASFQFSLDVSAYEIKSIKLHTTDGQLLQNIPVTERFVDLMSLDVKTGMVFLSIETSEGLAIKKVMIQE